MTLDARSLLQSWPAAFGIDAALGLAALVYTRGWLRLRAILPNLISTWRLAAFIAGIVAVWIAIGSALESYDEVLLSVHMVQHLLLMAIAPPLILLGAPTLPILHGLPRWATRGVAGPFLKMGTVKGIARAITHPVFCWLAATLALIVWHFPAMFDLALRSDGWHKLEHASFFGAGLLFWWPVIQPWPSAARWPAWAIPLYLFFATLPCDVLSAFLAFCDRVVYRAYLSAPGLFGFSALADQQCAAALMWTFVTIIYLIPAVIITIRILSPRREQMPAEFSAGMSGPGHAPEASK
jgi:cytochrome c oxidase assembly factor CtaG